MLPQLTGEGTPHDDLHARGVVFGLSPSTRCTDLVQAVLEGVAFNLRGRARGRRARASAPSALSAAAGTAPSGAGSSRA